VGESPLSGIPCRDGDREMATRKEKIGLVKHRG
jgi:hypothetical protein